MIFVVVNNININHFNCLLNFVSERFL